MTDTTSETSASLKTRDRHPLIGIPFGSVEGEGVQYFTSEDAADDALAEDRASLPLALKAIGAWSDVDPDEMLDAFDRIRHASELTPPTRLDA